MAETILIIGATGVFGRRLASHLAKTSGYRLVLASRSFERAKQLAEQLSVQPETAASLEPIVLDTTEGIGEALAAVRPRLVVDCSGPFQAMDCRVPVAAAAVGAHFVDLADGREYVLGFERALDELFRSNNLVALTGASSSPALAVAAVAELTCGWKRVDHIDISIMPGGRSEVGEAAVAAALSYCGKPVPIVASGVLDQAIGWGARRHVSLPSVGRRAVAPVETSDAELLHALYPRAAQIRFWAGLKSPLEQFGMALIARLRRLGWWRRPEQLAPLLTRARKLTRLTTGATGAMSVRVVGLDHMGRWGQAEWRLTARNNVGPHVPPSPAAAAVRAILAGRIEPGARPAVALPLEAIEAEFAGYAIETDRKSETLDRCFVEAAIGSAPFESLHAAVKAFHALDAPTVWAGRATIDGARAPLARIVAHAVGFPRAGSDVPVTVVAEREMPSSAGQASPTETWTRSFGARTFVSTIASDGAGGTAERFGPFSFAIGLAARDGRLNYPVTGWRIGPVPLPKAWAPRSEASEWEDELGRFNFDVRLSHPLVGMLAHYRGWLEPVQGPVGDVDVTGSLAKPPPSAPAL